MSSSSEKKKDSVPMLLLPDLFKLLFYLQPDVIIHCAAERKPDIVEGQPEKTRKINIDATRNICQLASKHIFVSEIPCPSKGGGSTVEGWGMARVMQPNHISREAFIVEI